MRPAGRRTVYYAKSISAAGSDAPQRYVAVRYKKVEPRIPDARSAVIRLRTLPAGGSLNARSFTRVIPNETSLYPSLGPRGPVGATLAIHGDNKFRKMKPEFTCRERPLRTTITIQAQRCSVASDIRVRLRHGHMPGRRTLGQHRAPAPLATPVGQCLLAPEPAAGVLSV